jgi:hypothetical protein
MRGYDVYRKEDNIRISVHEAGILRRVCVYGSWCFNGIFLQLLFLLIGIARLCSSVRWCVVCISSLLSQTVNSTLDWPINSGIGLSLSFGSRTSGPIKEPCDARVGLSHDNDEQRTCWGRMRAGILLVPSHAHAMLASALLVESNLRLPTQYNIHIRAASPLRSQCIARS